MTEADFAFLRELLWKRSGLSLTVEKRYLVESRLSTVCRQQNLASLSDLVRSVRGGSEMLTVAVVEAMTTNETLFFRDALPFKHFRELMLPALMRARTNEKTIRIWCAAASSGQEPYSLAMILDEMSAELHGWRIEILATDISGEMLEKARAGNYSQFEVQRGLPIQQLLRHFTQTGDRWQIADKLRRMVTFKHHNLINPQLSPGMFDIIFCRNVLIYFDTATKAAALNMLSKHIRTDGFLALGAAETVLGLTDAFGIDREHRGIYRPASRAVAQAEPIKAAMPGTYASAAPAASPAYPRPVLAAGGTPPRPFSIIDSARKR